MSDFVDGAPVEPSSSLGASVPRVDPPGGLWRLQLAAGVALIAMVGSLYLSEVRGFVPCNLCWWQRAMMYPLALQLLGAHVRRDATLRPHALVLAVVGFGVALVQNLEAWGVISKLGYCQVRSAAPCDVAWPVWSGVGLPAALDSWLSIPVMAMLAFAALIALLRRP